MDPKKVEKIKRFADGYKKRLAKYHDQPAMEMIEKDLKTAVKSGEPITQFLFTKQDFAGPHGSTRLLPLFEALDETG